ncbi:hypothetical protein BX600DRAFT_90750 [Xylariales sp. PMI_506]|nr:hypothetical protein BX600DRAFT_90750 [Xylariales sp. PMI_506]
MVAIEVTGTRYKGSFATRCGSVLVRNLTTLTGLRHWNLSMLLIRMGLLELDVLANGVGKVRFREHDTGVLEREIDQDGGDSSTVQRFGHSSTGTRTFCLQRDVHVYGNFIDDDYISTIRLACSAAERALMYWNEPGRRRGASTNRLVCKCCWWWNNGTKWTPQ